MEATPISKFASRFLNTTASHVFLTGKAGTGKTTFLKRLAEHTHKNFIVVAPTGIAALNAGGVTIHSQFLLPPATFIPDRYLPENLTAGGRYINSQTLARKHPLNSARKQVLRAIDLLVIDEVSMLRADLLDAIDYRLKAARGEFTQSFGGVQVLFIGDLFQLPPVVKNEEQELLSRYYASPWFYEATALRDNQPVYIELDKIFRQHDEKFIHLLNNLRNNTVQQADLDELNQHYKSAEEVNQLQEVITLTTHNYKADQLNRHALDTLASPPHYFEAIVDGEFPESMYPVQLQLELKQGAQIMFVRNDTSSDKKYFNGKLATVTRIEEDEVWVQMAGTHELYQLARERWENKRYAVDKANHILNEEVIGSFEQYPVKLAWAITVHKSQGLTFDKAIIDVGQAFADGQVYVALSRLRALDGLILRSMINPDAVRTDKHITQFATKAHPPEKLQTVIEAQQRVYITKLLGQTFSFEGLLKEINYIVKNKEPETFDDPTVKPVLVQLIDALVNEKTNTERFRTQLQNLLAQQLPQQLLERVEKGSAYYSRLLWENVRQLLRHIESVKHRKRSKTYLGQLQEIDQLFTRKLGEFYQVPVIVSQILSGTELFDLRAVRLTMDTERQKLLQEINPLPSEQKPSKKKKSTKTKDGKSTYDVTLELFKAGFAPEAIAKERGFAVSTIDGHLARAIETGKLDIENFIDQESIAKVEAAIKDLPESFVSKDLYDKLEGKFSYGKLKAVLAYRKSQRPEADHLQS
ncbi:MAG: helix-turn-helix domain-containing protein [Cyclobacteriaceae bacterium]|nr:helix-turn-helix domain-containing protein [Cyclobacteriaceae bacterium]